MVRGAAVTMLLLWVPGSAREMLSLPACMRCVCRTVRGKRCHCRHAFVKPDVAFMVRGAAVTMLQCVSGSARETLSLLAMETISQRTVQCSMVRGAAVTMLLLLLPDSARCRCHCRHWWRAETQSTRAKLRAETLSAS